MNPQYVSTLTWEDEGKIWKDPKGNWHSRCPGCNKVKTHKTRGGACDGVVTLCKDCQAERSENAWRQLRLLYKQRRQEDW